MHWQNFTCVQWEWTLGKHTNCRKGHCEECNNGCFKIKKVNSGCFKIKKVSLRWHRKKFVHTYISLQEAIQNFENRSSWKARPWPQLALKFTLCNNSITVCRSLTASGWTWRGWPPWWEHTLLLLLPTPPGTVSTLSSTITGELTYPISMYVLYCHSNQALRTFCFQILCHERNSCQYSYS